jgi:extradiol dioxygenase family protein
MCRGGRSSEQWVDLNFFGHQLVCHEALGMVIREAIPTNPFAGHAGPIPDFGVVLDMTTWLSLATLVLVTCILCHGALKQRHETLCGNMM